MRFMLLAAITSLAACTKEPPRRHEVAPGHKAPPPAEQPVKTAPKPLIDGQFELVSVDTPDGKTVMVTDVRGGKTKGEGRGHVVQGADAENGQFGGMVVPDQQRARNRRRDRG